ncbi:proline, histidine and glycine-rich protein 1 [Felis catus]|uniref:proline, histidine and glycine-rich protein 1 n=1 Tax=Felis catus TaxID=9685 RepID=UPI001D1993F8|nr:proline, histidine and glycine-rich protein 1 [Felis catus]
MASPYQTDGVKFPSSPPAPHLHTHTHTHTSCFHLLFAQIKISPSSLIPPHTLPLILPVSLARPASPPYTNTPEVRRSLRLTPAPGSMLSGVPFVTPCACCVRMESGPKGHCHGGGHGPGPCCGERHPPGHGPGHCPGGSHCPGPCGHPPGHGPGHCPGGSHPPGPCGHPPGHDPGHIPGGSHPPGPCGPQPGPPH